MRPRPALTLLRGALRASHSPCATWRPEAAAAPGRGPQIRAAGSDVTETPAAATWQHLGQPAVPASSHVSIHTWASYGANAQRWSEQGGGHVRGMPMSVDVKGAKKISSDSVEVSDEKEDVKVVSKAALGERVAARMGRRAGEGALWVNAVLLELAEALKRGERVKLVGFGAFQKKQRTFRLPPLLKDGKVVPSAPSAPSHTTKARPIFSAGASLVAFLNDPAAKPVAPSPSKPKAENEKEVVAVGEMEPKPTKSAAKSKKVKTA